MNLASSVTTDPECDEEDREDEDEGSEDEGGVIIKVKWFPGGRILGTTIGGTTLYINLKPSLWKWEIFKNSALWINLGPITFITYL